MTSDRYKGPHAAIRRAGLPYAYGKPCSRCGQEMTEDQDLDLDHDDFDGYRGFSHARCNRRAGGQRGAAVKHARDRARRQGARVITEGVLGVEVAEDRRHTSVAIAGWLPDEIVVVDLTAYLDGSDGVGEVLRLRDERTVLAVVVDPHSPAATLIRPLTEAGVVVTEPSTSNTVVAHGGFLDLLAGGRLRHTGRPEFDAAVRHATQRPLAGAAAWNRRGSTVDVSPLTAATLAVWGLTNHKSVAPWVHYE